MPDVAPNDLDAWLTAAEALPANTQDPITITLNLSSGNANKNLMVAVPPGYVLIVDGKNKDVTFAGASPALTVISGNVIFKNGVTFINTTDTATIRVEGGNLTLRGSTIEETTGGEQAAIEIIGGTVDLGTVAEPGGNTLVVNGDGQFIENQTTTPMLIIGNIYLADDTAVFSTADPVVVGTPAGEHLKFVEGANTGEIDVSVTGLQTATITGATKLVAYGGDGDDMMQVGGSVSLPVWLYGEGGNDKLRGGGGNDLLDGGLGDDLLVGKSGRDLLIGGSGADRIVGNSDDDILIAGIAQFNAANTDAVMDHWIADDDAAVRQTLINDYLAENNLDVADDDERDILTGSAGTDWFFANLEGDGTHDNVTDLDDELLASDLDFILAP